MVITGIDSSVPETLQQSVSPRFALAVAYFCLLPQPVHLES